MSEIHTAALEGFTKGAATYASGRPGYPDALIAWLRDCLGLAAGRTAIDLGAGTGKFTPLLRATGARVIAIEPVDAMRAQLVQRFPDVPACAGTASAMPLADGIADALVCAQSFHWFANPEALAEMHRVLRPGAMLGLVWNTRDESVEWVQALSDIMTPYEGDAPRYPSGEWRRVFPNELFSQPEETVLAHRHEGAPHEVILDRILSVSFIAALPSAEKARVERRVLELIETRPEIRGRTSVAFPYRTVAYRCRRR